MALDQMLSFDPKADFANRVARIQAGGLHTNRTLFVGNEEALALPPGAFRKKPRKSRFLPMFLALVTCGAGVFVVTMASVNLF
ncbi:hypothetical protein [Fuscovulum ytuae]|uniref:Uncharacterized protein n=1 Tax=Fuscovulum ytuae TaxID=3042299 RepID=A0ABY8Q7Z1_9RHOB|nr:hypothetical protein [Fuscovulum sp. YMD61]WGV16978.1 hypothetical protein QF092_03985 [Fuscovulum sp. YMD61]